MHRTVPVGASLLTLAAPILGAAPGVASERGPLNTLLEIGPALHACWRPPIDVRDFEIRVRLSFRRDGAVLGTPRIVYARFDGTRAEERIAVRAVVDALGACTPLRFTPSLGAAVAGRIFTIRFAPRQRDA